MSKLESTKAKLESAKKELKSTKAELESTKEELKSTKAELESVRESDREVAADMVKMLEIGTAAVNASKGARQLFRRTKSTP